MLTLQWNKRSKTCLKVENGLGREQHLRETNYAFISASCLVNVHTFAYFRCPLRFLRGKESSVTIK